MSKIEMKKSNNHSFSQAVNRAAMAFMALAVGMLVMSSLVADGKAASSKAASSISGGWIDQTNSKVRLIQETMPMEDASSFYAGVELRMDKGWKTYWRNPGDSGVPPNFNWSGSKNIESVEILYPVPHRFSDAGGTAIGYSGEVVFPLLITPKRPGEPVLLSLNFDYGLCKDLCIPNTVLLEAKFEPGKDKSIGADRSEGGGALLQSALEQVPKKAGDGTLPRLANISGELDGDAPVLEIEVEFPRGATGTDVFADNPRALVPVPKALGPLKGGKQRFEIAFPVREDAAALKGKPLTITLVADEGASETIWTAP